MERQMYNTFVATIGLEEERRQIKRIKRG